MTSSSIKHANSLKIMNFESQKLHLCHSCGPEDSITIQTSHINGITFLTNKQFSDISIELNFMLMVACGKILGSLPSLPFFLNIFSVGKGTDVAGEVVEVGPGVKSLKAGDKVVATINHAVRTHSYSFGFKLPFN